ncbi:MAG TPA: chaperone NapD [Nitrososphaera sp.]|nr:chaperone NapD [Nitrososphaera sp.]
MFIQCKKGMEEQILDSMKTIPEVKYSFKVDKAYDIVVKIESDSAEKFTSAISAIRSLHGLLNTDTMIGFKK